MTVYVDVVGQTLIVPNRMVYIEGTQEFIRFTFNLDDDWKGLTTFAQFVQDGVPYNKYLDSTYSVYLPSEIVSGICTLTIYGTGDGRIGTASYLTLKIDPNILVDGSGTMEITESLYEQLVDKVDELETWFDDYVPTRRVATLNEVITYLNEHEG